jgi:hypothetical protein
LFRRMQKFENTEDCVLITIARTILTLYIKI